MKKKKIWLYSLLAITIISSTTWYTLADEINVLKDSSTSEVKADDISSPSLTELEVDETKIEEITKQPYDAVQEIPVIDAATFDPNEYPQELISDELKKFPNDLEVPYEELLKDVKLSDNIKYGRTYGDYGLLFLMVEGSSTTRDNTLKGINLDKILGSDYQIVNKDKTLYDIEETPEGKILQPNVTKATHLEIISPKIPMGIVIVFDDEYFTNLVKFKEEKKNKELEDARIEAEKELLKKQQEEINKVTIEPAPDSKPDYNEDEEVVINVIDGSTWGEGENYKPNVKPIERETILGGSSEGVINAVNQPEEIEKYKVDWGVAENIEMLKANQYYSAEKALMNTYLNANVNVIDIDGNKIDTKNLKVVEGKIQPTVAMKPVKTSDPTKFYIKVVILIVIMLSAFAFTLIASEKHNKLLNKERVRNRFKLEDDNLNNVYMDVNSEINLK